MMRESAIEIGIVGVVPSGFVGAYRATSFQAFQKVGGVLEAAPPQGFPALHAVCHALMNGIDAVQFVGVGEIDDIEPIARAVTQLVGLGVALVVCPGLSVKEHGSTLASTFAETDTKATLWLSAPAGATPTEAMELQKQFRGSKDAVRVVLPHIQTLSPGRRALELLEPAALVGPLALGTVVHLKGTHEVPKPPPANVRDDLRAAGLGLIVPSGARRLAALAFPEALSTPVDKAPAVPTLHQRIERALDIVCDQYAGWRSHHSTWKSIERDARSVMRKFQSRGEVADFKVRCDEETNLDCHDAIGLEVLYTVPKRVQEFVLKMRPRS